jgi:2-amino-4-hydroxy-6-hydroxymethyldihydropteridine diphosphokinase
MAHCKAIFCKQAWVNRLYKVYILKARLIEYLTELQGISRSPNMQSSDISSIGLAAIALGSNLGNSLEIVESALQSLARKPDLNLVAVSRWYKTIAIGPPQPDYINGCALVEMRSPSKDAATGAAPQALLDILFEIEQQFGRERTQHWGPRTLDLDLLLYDAIVLHTATLTLPHPRMTERAFVLVPLAEILPDWVEPITGLTIRRLRNQVDCTGVSLLSS